MRFFTISAINAGLSGWVGTITDPEGTEVYRTAAYESAQRAFNVAYCWLESKQA